MTGTVETTELTRERIVTNGGKSTEDGQSPGLPPDSRRDGKPGWADELKKIYNSVVDEPLPGSFEDLLKKLDDADDNGAGGGKKDG
ncbi:MAG: hypothetical protein KDE32_04045 [Novosphingobium sp.]|nr:hypothetical protein [Novosphingobium sp.]